MRITTIEVRVCQNTRPAMSDSEMRSGGKSTFDFLVITMKTDEGIEGRSFGFAGRGAEMAGAIAASALKPYFLGKDPLFREKHWKDFRTYDRWWNHVPIYSYGPFDICLYDIAAKKAGMPLYKMLGACREKVPIYASSFVLETPEAYAKQALEVKGRGWHAYKLHPPGKLAFDLAAYRACRDAVGPDFKLMADPVAAYSYEEALRIGRELEKLNYYWLEEPLFDVDFSGLRKLTDKLDLPICGTEVLAGSHYSTAECIASRVVDIVRTDVSWKGGVTPVMKTAHLAESFGVHCELHTTIYHPLEIVNLHCCAAISNCEFFEVLYPLSYMDFGMKTPIHVDNEGYAHPPEVPGIGVDWDWDFIEKCTTKVL
ncbi:MAG TPA: enolase C-terminal domain-like protein [Candidatus Solibacter sp.]|nr:enolase C-terminal domain-like protein [Candidatus Solibacter sp.]